MILPKGISYLELRLEALCLSVPCYIGTQTLYHYVVDVDECSGERGVHYDKECRECVNTAGSYTVDAALHWIKSQITNALVSSTVDNCFHVLTAGLLAVAILNIAAVIAIIIVVKRRNVQAVNCCL